MRSPSTRPIVLAALVIAAVVVVLGQEQERRWLAGDSHIHSHWSPGYDRSTDPPTPVKGQDAIYSTPTNARKAEEFGLSWMVTTDHGGPNHAKFNLEQAYAELVQSRTAVPGVLQFYGMELNMPAMDHHTLIVPRTGDEGRTLFDIEERFDSNESWPPDPSRDTEASALRALAFVRTLERLPLMFANHPSRSATGVGRYGLDEPREFRANHDLAPEVYRGMEGAPGHQANTLAPDGSVRTDASGIPSGHRGSYANPGAGTFGGFDQMTARVGGLWDALLGEGRRFWIVATSDSHVHYTETSRAGGDFWPGEYQKTYVLAHKTYDDVLDGLRRGRTFAVSGDLVTTLSLSAEHNGARAEAGETLSVPPEGVVTVTVRFTDPIARNPHGDDPTVSRVDVILGQLTGPTADRNADTNETTTVIGRFTAREWSTSDGVTTITTTLPRLTQSAYVRVRGTNTNDLEPTMDLPGENPWTDLWMYSNPVFLDVSRGH